MSATTLNALRRKLQRAELDLLRTTVAAQGAEIERLQRELDSAAYMEQFWQEHANDLQNELYEQSHGSRQIGLTQDGTLLVLHTQTQEPTP